MITLINHKFLSVGTMILWVSKLSGSVMDLVRLELLGLTRGGVMVESFELLGLTKGRAMELLGWMSI
jgi:hypothetical protein